VTPPHPHEVDRSRSTELAVLIAAKTVANTALRWVGPFLPTLERAFDTTVGTLTSVIGVAELGGLTTAATGRQLDRGHRRRLFVAGLWAVALSSAIALIGTVQWFAVAFVVLVVGVANLTVAGLALISARVPYSQRGRAIGLFETSWALALLLGAPTIALLISAFGWRGPFVALAAVASLAALAVGRFVSADVTTARAPRTRGAPAVRTQPLPTTAWLPLLSSALVAAAGLSVFVVSGAFLSDRHSVSTAGLGLVAMGFGALELVSSGSAAAFSDRIGKRLSVALGLVVLFLGLGLTASSDDSLVVAVLGLTLFLCGFEYAFVTSLSLMSEAAPLARGKALGIGNSIGTVARAGAVFASGQLYERVGISGSLALSAVAGAAALALLALSRAAVDPVFERVG
jgi:MFS transporter, DHA1 family, inner membrane transport protein